MSSILINLLSEEERFYAHQRAQSKFRMPLIPHMRHYIKSLAREGKQEGVSSYKPKRREELSHLQKLIVASLDDTPELSKLQIFKDFNPNEFSREEKEAAFQALLDNGFIKVADENRWIGKTKSTPVYDRTQKEVS